MKSDWGRWCGSGRGVNAYVCLYVFLLAAGYAVAEMREKFAVLFSGVMKFGLIVGWGRRTRLNRFSWSRYCRDPAADRQAGVAAVAQSVGS